MSSLKMTSMTTHGQQALDHLAAVSATTHHLERLHEGPYVDRREVAAAYDSIRQGLKIAEVHALLAIASALEDARPLPDLTGRGVTM